MTGTAPATPGSASGGKAIPAMSRNKMIPLVTALILSVLAFQLGASLLSPAVPHMATDFGVGSGDIAQVQSLFFLSGSVFGMALSRWSDAIGRRRALMLSLGMVLIGSVLALTATGLPMLLVGRVLQGSSSASLTIAFLILSEELSTRQFGVAVGVVTAVNGGLGGLDGYIGGALTESLGWRSLFGLILAVAVLATVAVLFFVPSRKPSEGSRMDWWGALLLALTIVALTQFISSVSAEGFSTTTVLYLAGAVLAGVVFVLVERRSKKPLIAVSALRSRTVWPILLTTIFTLAGVFSATNFTIVVLSQDPVHGFGMDATTSGLMFLTPTAIAGLIAATVAGWLALKIGWHVSVRMALSVLLVLSVALAIFAFDKWVVFGILIVMGAFYLGQFQPTVNGLSVLNAPADAPGSLPGINGACYGLGAGAGIALVAPLVNLANEYGYRSALWVSVALVAVGVVTAFTIKPTLAARNQA